jgi:hypothetical protein
MEGSDRDPAAWGEEQAALRMILEGTASETGERFFMALVENLARALGTYGAWVTEYMPQARTLRALAFRLGDRWVQDFEHPIDGSPCSFTTPIGSSTFFRRSTISGAWER